MQVTVPVWLYALSIAIGPIGALVGAFGAPWLTARITSTQWRRQTRMDAYAALAKAIDYLIEALRVPEKATEPGLEDAPQGIKAGILEMARAMSVVRLVGAPAVRHALRDLDSWLTKTDRFVLDYKANQAGELAGIADDLTEKCKGFIEAARKDLGLDAVLPSAELLTRPGPTSRKAGVQP